MAEKSNILRDYMEKALEYSKKKSLKNQGQPQLIPTLSPDDVSSYIPLSVSTKRGWETDEQYDRRMQEERQQVATLFDYNQLLREKEYRKLDAVANTNYVKDLMLNIRLNKQVPYEYYEMQAAAQLADERKGEKTPTGYVVSSNGELVNPFLASDYDRAMLREAGEDAAFGSRLSTLQDTLGYFMDFNSTADQYLKDHNSLFRTLLNQLGYDGPKDFDSAMNWMNQFDESGKLSDRDKQWFILKSQIKDMFGDEAFENIPALYELYKSHDLEDMKTLASIIVTTQLKGMSLRDLSNTKASESIDKFTDNVFGGFKYTKEKGMELVRQAFRENPFSGTWDLFTGGSAALVGAVGSIADTFVDKGLGWIYEHTFGKDEKNKAELISKYADDFIAKTILPEYEKLTGEEGNTSISKERKAYLLKLFDEASRDKLYGSTDFRAYEGTYLTELSEEDKLKVALEYEAVAGILGTEVAQQRVKDFWQNTVALKQTWTDALNNTCGQFLTTAAADLLSMAAIILNVFDPDTYREGYSDALVKDNTLMRMASNIMETGSVNEAEQLYYKELGINKYQALRTKELEGSILTWDDIQDAIGQYGFTIGSTIISMGGAAYVKSSANLLTKAALSGNKIGRAFYYVNTGFKPEARAIYKALLQGGEAAQSATKALEKLNSLKAARLYRGNLMLDACVGTAEGGLEAIGTYDAFKEKYSLTYQIQRQEELLQAIQSIYETPEASDLSVEERIAQATEEINSKYDDIMQQVEDNAADAAFINFVSNSMINGILAVTMKELTLSKDGRLAARQALGRQKRISDYIDIKKVGLNTKQFVATVKDEYLKKGNFKKLAWNTAKKAAENIGGEALEEFTQGVSDSFAQAVMEDDLKHYVDVVYNGGGIDAYTMDIGSALSAGLNGLVESATDRETLFSAYMGGLSGIVGGVNPIGGIINARQAWKAFRRKVKSDDYKDLSAVDKLKGIAGLTWDVTKGFGQSALFEGYREQKRERDTAEALAESVNEWLHNPKNKELITHLGGLGGFKASMAASTLEGDLFGANNSKLGAAVETIFMMDALKDTLVGASYLDTFTRKRQLLESATFDENGRLVVDPNSVDSNTVERIRQAIERSTGEEASDEQVMQAIQRDMTELESTISEFRNSNGIQSRDMNISDKQVIDRIAKNLDEFLELRNKVVEARAHLAKVMHDDNMDPMVEKVYVHAMLAQEDYRKRYNNLKERLDNALNSDALTEEQKKSLEQTSDMHPALKSLLIEYGSLEAAKKELEKLHNEINEATVQATDKKKALKERQSLRKEVKYKSTQAAHLQGLIELAENYKKEAKEEGAVSTETTEDDNSEYLFTEGDIRNMDEETRAQVLGNKEIYSIKQLSIINNFLKIALAGLRSQEGQVDIDTKEVQSDFLDLVRLKSSSKLYDDYLIENIENNKEMLNLEVAAARSKKRADILEYLYKEDLELKEGEVYEDVALRIKKRQLELIDKGKVQDARLLARVMRRNSKIKNIYDAYQEFNGMQYVFYSRMKDEHYVQAICGFRTLIDQGYSIEKIKELLLSSNIDDLKKALRRQVNFLGEGGYLLNHFLKKENQDIVDLSDNSVLEDIISEMNILMNIAITNQKAAEKKVQTKSVKLPTERQTPPPPTVTASVENGESQQFTVSSLSNLDPSTGLFHFFNDILYMNENLTAFNNRKDKLRLVVYQHSLLGPILLVAKVTNNLLNIGAFEAQGDNDNYYQAVGYIDLNKEGNLSATLKNELEKQGAVTRVVSDILTVNHIQDVKGRNVEGGDTEEYPSILLLLKDRVVATGKTLESLISNFADAILNGRWVEPTREQSEKRQLVDLFGHPINLVRKNGRTSISIPELPVSEANNMSLADFFGQGLTDEQLTEKLENSLFFRRIYDYWQKQAEYFRREGIIPDENKLKYFLQNFIYFGTLGKVELQDGADGEKLLVIYPNKQSQNPLIIDFPINKPAEMRNAVTKMLRALIQHAAELEEVVRLTNTFSQDNFSYLYPLLSVRFDNSTNKLSDIVVNLKRGVISDLIAMDVLTGNVPTSNDRGNFQIKNPFFKATPSNKQGHPTNADDGDPVDPTDPPVERPQIDLDAEAVRQRQENAKRIVDDITEKSKEYILPDKDSDFYEKGETKHARVTTVEYSTAEGGVTKPLFANVDKIKGKVASAHGTFVDNLLRNFLEIMNSDRLPQNWSTMSLQKQAQWLLNAIKASSDFGDAGTGNTFPLGYDNVVALTSFIGNLIRVKELMDERGWTIYPKDIKAFGNLKVSGTNKELPVAGTLDLLVVDDKGIFHIIDMKTKSNDAYYEGGVQRSKEVWEIQVALYQQLLQERYPDMVFGENYIFPIKTSYVVPHIEDANDIQLTDDGMTVIYKQESIGSAVREPELQAKFSPDEATSLEDFLIKLNGKDSPITLDGGLLTEEQRDMLIDVSPASSVESTTSSGNSGALEIALSPAEEGPQPTPLEFVIEESPLETANPALDSNEGFSLDDDYDYSTRTKKQAVYTDFVTDRLKPVTLVAATTLAKVFRHIRRMLVGKEGVRLVTIRDLANTFFAGNTTKLQQVAGKNPYSNLSKTVESIRTYFQSRLAERPKIEAALNREHIVSKNLKSLLSGEINEDTFLDNLENNGIPAHLVNPYIEWKASFNRDEYAKLILLNLEKSRIYDEAVLRDRLEVLKETYADMEAQLEFLNSNNVVDVLRTRLKSVEEALLHGKVIEEQVNKKGTMDSLMRQENTVYGAVGILEDIISRTLNDFTRELATTLLRNIKHNGIGIIISVNPNISALVEGATDGYSISLNSNTLKDYKTAERVLLHELIHCVVKASPEMKDQLNRLRSEAVLTLASRLGKSEEEITKLIYGFKNVDEFISEFFTNYAFQVQLLEISKDEEAHTSIFQKIVQAIVNFFRGRNKNQALYNRIETAMNDILTATNTPSTNRKEQPVKVPFSNKQQFSNLNKETQDAIKALGGTAKQFDAMSKVEQLYVLRCCSF